MTATSTTVPLAPNLVEHFYRGGERLLALRDPGRPAASGAVLRCPEEWLASTVARWRTDGVGLTLLGDGRGALRDVIAADPQWWLGAAHVDRWGPTPAVLVKLIDAAERLPVHVHPTRRFAARHLDCPFGKTEAWVVLDVPADGGTVFVGANRPVDTAEWAQLVAAQSVDTMLGLLNPLAVRPGDAVVVPAGTLHAIGAGTFVVELQEPTDFSILLEWEGFALDGPRDGHLDLGFDTALRAVRRDALDGVALDALIRRADPSAPAALPPAADAYFRAWHVRPPATTVPAAFSVVVAIDGDGVLRTDRDELAVRRGEAYVVAHGAGGLTFSGALTAVVAQPPDPAAPEPIEWDAP